MVKFINKNGGMMFVDDSRVEEYIKAGHKPADTPAPAPTAETKKPSRRKGEK